MRSGHWATGARGRGYERSRNSKGKEGEGEASGLGFLLGKLLQQELAEDCLHLLGHFRWDRSANQLPGSFIRVHVGHAWRAYGQMVLQIRYDLGAEFRVQIVSQKIQDELLARHSSHLVFAPVGAPREQLFTRSSASVRPPLT
jgi:hypothetical protein